MSYKAGTVQAEAYEKYCGPHMRHEESSFYILARASFVCFWLLIFYTALAASHCKALPTRYGVP